MIADDGGVDSLGGEVGDGVVNPYPAAHEGVLGVFLLVVALRLQCKSTEREQYNGQKLFHDNRLWLILKRVVVFHSFWRGRRGFRGREVRQSGRD